MRRFPWLALILFLLGAALGVYYSWVVSPVRYVDTPPDSLRADFKDQMRASIAAAYAATGDLQRARVRINLLEDTDPVQALNAQAQRMVASGDPYGSVEQVARLAVDLQAGAPVAQAPTATRLPTQTFEEEPTAETPPVETPIPGETTEPPAPTTDASEAAASPTPRPTRTPTSRPGLPYGLVSQDTLCEEGLAEGLLQVVILDTRRRPAPGREVIAAWDSGEEHFFTGLKPELGNGYADFVMQAGTFYSVRVAAGGPPVTGVTPPSCTAEDGTVTTGQIKLTFQQGR